MRVVFTGTLSKPRNELITEFAKYGIVVESTINGRVNYLITNTPDSGTSKNVKAQQLGIERISENDFRQRFFVKGVKFERDMVTTKPNKNAIVVTGQLRSSFNPSKETTNMKKSDPSKETILTRYLDF